MESREQKIKLLQNIAQGKVSVEDAFVEKPDMTKPTDDELRKIRSIQERTKKNVSILTDEDKKFLQDLNETLENRPPDYGINKH